VRGNVVTVLALKLLGAIDAAASQYSVYCDGTLHGPRLLGALFRLELSGTCERPFVTDALNKLWQMESACRVAMGCPETAIFFAQLCSKGFEGVDMATRLSGTLARFDYRLDGEVAQHVHRQILLSLRAGIAKIVCGVDGTYDGCGEVDHLCAAWYEMLDDWADEQWELVREVVDPALLPQVLRMKHAAVACVGMLVHFRAEVEDMRDIFIGPISRMVVHGNRNALRTSLRLLGAAPGLAVAMMEDPGEEASAAIAAVVSLLRQSDRAARLLVLRLCAAICNMQREDVVRGLAIDLDELEGRALGDDENEEEIEQVDTLRQLLERSAEEVAWC
jgi:hypothetical protein